MITNIFVNEILERVTMQDVLNKYHKLGKRKRTQCPIHAGEDNNFCYTDTVFHCWSCGAKGNAFSFVKQLFKLDAQQAISRINYDFNLCFPIGERLTIRQKQEFKRQEQKRIAERKRIQAEKQAKENLYWDLWGEWIRLDINSRKYSPKNNEVEFHPLFVEACHKLDYQSYLIDCLT